MDLDAKLDEIIARLARIEAHLGIATTVVETELVTIPTKPTKAMLHFKHMMEFASDMDRKFFFSAIRKRAPEMLELRKKDPRFRLSFRPQMLPKIDEKIQKTGAQFYKDLKVQILAHAKAVEEEGEKVLDRAIDRLTARM
ncbi:hypothetical protein [Mucilaginibacter segetis]|uniref:Uncharacterized protein n=1 Tax=Mucilaginibacter segetis TaxID=2793071 RepID=A0A934PTW2_9SPHI|nr:hypothetical protein [Mucilaginibacter segetis]MBK0379320.1 hypothetical protein [Mucilaginibacter segetis]